ARPMNSPRIGPRRVRGGSAIDQPPEPSLVTELATPSSGSRARMASALRQVMNLRRSGQAGKALRGSAWSIAGYGVQTALRFVSRIVLAKLLLNAAPLGTVAVITTILMGLEMISDLGIGVNIVQ